MGVRYLPSQDVTMVGDQVRKSNAMGSGKQRLAFPSTHIEATPRPRKIETILRSPYHVLHNLSGGIGIDVAAEDVSEFFGLLLPLFAYPQKPYYIRPAPQGRDFCVWAGLEARGVVRFGEYGVSVRDEIVVVVSSGRRLESLWSAQFFSSAEKALITKS